MDGGTGGSVVVLETPVATKITEFSWLFVWPSRFDGDELTARKLPRLP